MSSSCSDCVVTLPRAIDFFSRSDGRDKLGKTIQNACKTIAWYNAADKVTSQRYSAVAKSLSEFRSLLKFFKWLNNVRDLGALSESKTFGAREFVETACNIGDLGYRIGDNIEYLSKYKFLSFDPAQAERISKLFQFWGYFFSVIQDVMVLNSLKTSDKDYRKKLAAARLDLIKDTFDFLRVLPNMNYVPVPQHAGAQAAFGTIAGAIGAFQIWQKSKA